MKPKDINKPADLIKGDYVLFVTWNMCSSKAAKIEKSPVDDIFEPTRLNVLLYGDGEDGLGREWNPKKWIFQRKGAWDLRKTNWGDELHYSGRVKIKIFHLSDLKEAERFAKVEVPKKQLEAVLERINDIQNNFTSKVTEMEELERILQKNIDSCGE